jgi:hypothetical protein
VVKLVDTLDLGSSARAWGFESLQGHQNVPCSNGYSDPEDEKWCSNHGWFQSNRTGAGNATTVPVGERVEGVRDGVGGSRRLMLYNYRRGTQSISEISAVWFSASALGAEGRRFESYISDQYCGLEFWELIGLISRTEVGSIPTPATKLKNKYYRVCSLVAQW